MDNSTPWFEKYSKENLILSENKRCNESVIFYQEDELIVSAVTTAWQPK